MPGATTTSPGDDCHDRRNDCCSEGRSENCYCLDEKAEVDGSIEAAVAEVEEGAVSAAAVM